MTAPAEDAAVTFALTSLMPPSLRFWTSSVALSASRTTPLASVEPVLQGDFVATVRKYGSPSVGTWTAVTVILYVPAAPFGMTTRIGEGVVAQTGAPAGGV